MPGSQRRYRTKVEILRAFLEAARESPRKTRIIGVANLSPTTFRRYDRLARSLGLVEEVDGEYRLTSRAVPVIQSIDRLLARGRETDAALRGLRPNAHGNGGDPGATGPAMRYISRMAWEELNRHLILMAPPPPLPAPPAPPAGPPPRMPDWLARSVSVDHFPSVDLMLTPPDPYSPISPSRLVRPSLTTGPRE
jgi:predicted transcriptional regulator